MLPKGCIKSRRSCNNHQGTEKLSVASLLLFALTIDGKSIKIALKAMPKDDPGLAALNKQMEELVKENDKRSDDTWGELYRNLHQSADRMLEKNVNRDAP